MKQIISDLEEMGFDTGDFYAVSYVNTIKQMHLQGLYTTALEDKILKTGKVVLQQADSGYIEGQFMADKVTIKIILT